MGEPPSGFWHGLGHPSGMDGYMDGWVRAVGVQVLAQGARPAGTAWVAGVPMTLTSGHADKGCLQSPELPPSECCPQPHPKSPLMPLECTRPPQLSRSMGRIPVDAKPMACMPPPWSNAAGPHIWPRGQQGPIRRHQEPIDSLAGSGAAGCVPPGTA